MLGHTNAGTALPVLILSALLQGATACPYPCTCTNLQVNCYSKGLKEIPDNFPPDVISIDLQYNEIENIGDQFHNLTSLQEVMLRFNRISHLADGTFTNLPNLRHINLGSNVITNLSRGAFQNVSQMSTLDLTDNQLTGVEGCFEGLSSLTKLVLTRNVVEELTDNILTPLTSLIYFMADENRIAHVHPSAFHGLKELSYVSLIKNPLRTMDNVLSTNTMLSYLNLDDCQLTHVPAGLPWATRNLQLQRNNISAIYEKTFLPTRYLGIINLNNNGITQVERAAFTPIAHLQELWLNGNHLTTIPAQVPLTMHTLSLDNNNISTVSDAEFPHDSQMKVLSLKGNAITTIDPFTFARLGSLKKLHLRDNGITQLQDKSFSGMRNLTLLDVGRNPIMHIDVRFAAGLHKLDILDLSYIQDSEPLMKGNFFRDVPFLKTLLLRSSPSLAHNILTSNETLKSFHNLEELDMRDNDLQSLDIDLPRFFPNLRRLWASGNPWVCDPRLLWLHDWMQASRDIFVDAEQVLCAEPPHLAGDVIADLPYHAFFYTTTLPTTSTTAPTTQETTAEESVESGDVDTDLADTTQFTTRTRFTDTTTLENISFPSMSSEADQTGYVSQPTTVRVSIPEGHTEDTVPDELYTTNMGGRTTDASITGKEIQPVTSTAINMPTSTSYPDTTTTTTAEKTTPVIRYTTTASATHTVTPASPSSSEGTGKLSGETTTVKSWTSVKQTTESPQTLPPMTPMSRHTPSVPDAPDTTTTALLTETPRHGGSKNPSDVPSPFPTRTVIIAACVAGTALIIVIVAVVLFRRRKGKYVLVLHRALAPSSQAGDRELVLGDQDDLISTPDCNPMTDLSRSEQGSSSPSVETASDDGLCTRLV